MKIKALIASISGLLLSSLLTVSSSAVTFPDIDGVKQGRVPYLVALWTVDSKTNARKDLYCTGVLIDRFHFLTAAHCLDIKQWFVAVGGVTDASQRGQTLIVTDFELHPRYDAKSYQNDIAIARLYYGVDNAAEWGKFIGSYPTIPDNDKSFRKDMRLFGWGLKQNNRPSYVVTSVPQTEFKSEAGKAFRTFNEATMLGAGFWYPSEKLYAGACNGDSGGPLLANESTKPTLIGLVSYGSAKGCDVKKPTVYTRVAYYKPWINKTIAKTTLSHGLSYGLTLNLGLSHGLAVGLCLKEYLGEYQSELFPYIAVEEIYMSVKNVERILSLSSLASGKEVDRDAIIRAIDWSKVENFVLEIDNQRAKSLLDRVLGSIAN